MKKKGNNAFLWGWGIILGIALLYLQLYRVTCDQTYLLRSLDYVKRTLRNLNGRRVTFLCGDAGPLAVGAVVYHKLKSDCESQECITKWVFKTGSIFSKFSIQGVAVERYSKRKLFFNSSLVANRPFQEVKRLYINWNIMIRSHVSFLSKPVSAFIWGAINMLLHVTLIFS